MSIDIEKLKAYFSQAEEEKGKIKPKYNEVFELVDTSSTISDAGKLETIQDRNIDGGVTDPIDSLVSYLMTSLFSRTGEWASASIDEVKYKVQFGEGSEGKIEEVNKILLKDVEKVVNYIQSSNYYVEIVKSMKDLVEVGTGAFAIRETGIPSYPFNYEYLGIDNLFILSSVSSLPMKVFKKHPDITAIELQDIFTEDIKLPEGVSEDNYTDTFDVYECSIPIYDEGELTYEYVVMDSSLDEILLERVLKYNPMPIVRWDVNKSSSWGESIVSKNISIVKDINEYKEIYKTQAYKIANPAVGFFGARDLYNAYSTQPGAVNYFGNPAQGTTQAGIQDLSNQPNLMPLDKLIQDQRNMFRKVLMAEDIGMKAMDNKYTTATAIRISHELFRQRFGMTYELINSELLKPAFMGPFTIMLKYELLDTPENALPLLGVKYTNELTKSANRDKDNNITMATDRMLNLIEKKKQGVAMNLSVIIPDIIKNNELNPEYFPASDEILSAEEWEAKVKKAQETMLMEQAQQVEANKQQGGGNGQGI